MTSLTRIGAGVLALTLCAATSASAQLGMYPQGDFNAFLGNLEWEPDCDSYWPSYYSQRDADALRIAIDGWTSCVDRQARNDVQVAVKAIEKGRDEAVQDKLRQIRSY